MLTLMTDTVQRPNTRELEAKTAKMLCCKTMMSPCSRMFLQILMKIDLLVWRTLEFYLRVFRSPYSLILQKDVPKCTIFSSAILWQKYASWPRAQCCRRGSKVSRREEGSKFKCRSSSIIVDSRLEDATNKG